MRLAIILFSLLFFASCDTTNSNPDLSEYTFFKVGETLPDTEESYIIALTDSLQIEHARMIISNPEIVSDKIILAKIIPQNGTENYQNIDLNSNTVWSWRVDEFIGFVFTTIEIYDGWPGYIEEDLNRWFQNTSDDPNSGVIGFWGFTVLEEIDSDKLK